MGNFLELGTSASGFGLWVTPIKADRGQDCDIFTDLSASIWLRLQSKHMKTKHIYT